MTEAAIAPEYRLYGVRSTVVCDVWEEAAPLLKKACDRYRRHKISDIREYCEQGIMGLWLVYGKQTEERPTGLAGAFTTQILVYPERKVCAITYCGGEDVDGWIEWLYITVENYARSNQCHEVEVWGRPGWKKKLGGYKMEAAVFTKIL